MISFSTRMTRRICAWYFGSDSLPGDLRAVALATDPGLLNRRLELAVAGRRTKESKDAERTIVYNDSELLEDGGLSHISYNRTNPEGTVTWHWSDSFSTYAKVATAFESGGALETAPPGDFQQNTYQAERLHDLRAGLEIRDPRSSLER